jgi:hypothetical protein
MTPEKNPKLIVLAAFDETDDGELTPTFDAKQFDSEERATRDAKILNIYPGGIGGGAPIL